MTGALGVVRADPEEPLLPPADRGLYVVPDEAAGGFCRVAGVGV